MMKSLATLAALFAFVGLTACSHGSSSTSQTTTTTGAGAQSAATAAASPGEASVATASPEATISAEASTAAAAPAAGGGQIPNYPGSTQVMSTTANGVTSSVSTTKDGFDAVYGWYKAHLPANAEQERATIGGAEEAVFKIGDSAVSVTSANGQTEINIQNKP